MPERHYHFCLLEEAEGEGLICREGPSPGAAAFRWAGEAAGRTVRARGPVQGPR